jgi:tetratricopeptide (TPR) repeat protein
MVEVAALDLQPAFENREVETNQTLPIAELEKQISQIQAKNANSPALAILYDRLGQAYTERITSGNSKNLQVDIDQAIASFQQAIELQRKLNLKLDLGNTLIRLGHLYKDLSQYQKAEICYEQALEITRNIGDRQQEATAINGLGNVYKSLGKYKEAIAIHQQSLEIHRQIKDRQGEADSLGNLGNAYDSLGEYQQAVAFYQQQLDIVREIGDRRGEANAWFNLGLGLKELQREADALGAFRNAHQLYQAMELDSYVQDCDNEINALSAPISPSPPPTPWEKIRQTLRRFWRWLSHLFH